MIGLLVYIVLFGVVTIGAAVIAVQGYSQVSDNILLLSGALILSVMSLWGVSVHPALALMVTTISGLLLPFQIPTGTNTTLNMSILLAAALSMMSLLKYSTRAREVAPLSSAALLPMALFLIVTVVALLVGQMRWFDASQAPAMAQFGGLAIILFSGGIFWASAREMQDLEWLRKTTNMFLAVSGCFVLMNVVPGVPALPTPNEGATGSLFWTWLISLSFSMALLNREWSGLLRLATSALTLATLYLTAIERHDWASGWMPGCAAIFAILALRYPLRTSLLVCLAAVLAAVTYQNWIDLIWSPDQQYSAMTRSAAAQVVAEMIQRNPVFGFGPANYYHYTPLFSILGWHVNFSTHNNYLDILLQTGIIGLACLIWFFAALARTSLRLRRLAPPGFSEAFAYGSIGGLIGTICAGGLGDWFLPFVYNVGLKGFAGSVVAWVFLGGIVALEQVYSKKQEPGLRT